jgi:hypothetical protein
MPLDFSDKETVFNRAVRIWAWRKPHKDETFEEYRTAFSEYVRRSDPEEADAISAGRVLTKWDPVTSN